MIFAFELLGLVGGAVLIVLLAVFLWVAIISFRDMK